MNDRILLFLLSLFSIGMTSCENELPGVGTTEVRVSLQIEEDIGSMEDAEMCLNYVECGEEKSVQFAVESGNEVHAFALPAGSLSSNPFIELVFGGSVYSYSPTVTCFDEGCCYSYALVLDAEGLSLADFNATIEGWEVVDVEVSAVDATM